MLRRHFRRFVYCLVATAFFSASAGSFDDFFIAIRNDDANALVGLLQRGFDPNTRDEKGAPGLTIAMQVHAEKAAKLLLQHPTIDVNALNAAGESALMMAALKGDLAGAKLLLASGAHLNQPGWSALHYAASGPRPELVQLLLEQGATVNARSPNGTTPLMMAARYGSEDSVRLLLKRGADPKLANQRDLRAADFARLAGRESLASRLDALAR